MACALLGGCGQTEHAAAPAAKQEVPVRQAGQIVVPSDSPKLGRIRVAPVELGRFEIEQVIVPGKVEANPNRISRVLMPVSGRVLQVLVRLGDAVAEGQPLVEIDSADAGAAQAAWAQSQAQIRQARSAQAKAERDLARLRELYSHRAAALKEVQAAENDVVQAQAALDQAQASNDEALHRLELLGLEAGKHTRQVTVRAPIAGKVLEIAVAPGEYRNDTSTSLMTIADLRSVWLSAQVPESEIRHIQVGEGISVELSAYPGEVFRARVTRIADMVDPQTRTIKVQAEIPNPSGRLRPEMFGQFRHSHGSAAEPAVPAGAIVETGGKSVVLVEDSPGVFHEQAITVGERQGDRVSVQSGLKPGERVVVDGVMLLRKTEEPQ